MKLTDDKKGAIFRKLASKTMYEVGIEFDLDKHYASPQSLKTAVYGIYRQVKMNPDQYAIQTDTLELVTDAVSNRKVANTPRLSEKLEDTRDIKTLVMTNRDIAARLINKKLLMLDNSKKALNNESLVSLGKIMGILFDKAQIIQGQATEHVALMGKIDTSLSPEASLDLVLKMREINEASKETK